MHFETYLPQPIKQVPDSVWVHLPKIVEKPFFKKNNKNYIAENLSTRKPIEMEEFLSIGSNCEALQKLLALSQNPGEGMTHQQRFALAQIARQSGLPDPLIVEQFKERPNFDPATSMKNVQSVDLTYRPPSCKSLAARLSFCNGRCANICNVGGGSPLAFLKTKKSLINGGKNG